jgi:DNA-binding GntR family transcriptional regulator
MSAIGNPVARLSEQDEVFRGIREAITRQRLPPGTRLHEEALAGVFGVSRTRIRSALQRLQHTGLVTSGKNQIARVAEPSVREARDLFATRMVLEPEIAAKVGEIWTPAIDKRLRKQVEAEHTAREHGDRMEATRLAGDFHVVLAEVADNSVMLKLITEIIDRTFLVIFLYQLPTVTPCVHSEHLALIEAMASGNRKKAGDQMRNHIRGIESRMVLEERSEQVVDLGQAFSGIVGPKVTQAKRTA